MDDLHRKKAELEASLRKLGSVAVAFSAGVDSTLLLSVAKEALGDRRVIALTASVSSFPQREQDEAAAYCRSLGIRHFMAEIDQLSIEGFRCNPANRCYLCKRSIFSRFLQLAAEQGIVNVVEGSNADDMTDYRPGMLAISELGIHSPLKDAGLSKEEIRVLSRELDLPTWSKPSMACLATRFEYGELITKEKLSMVEKAEQFLLDLGFHQVRVRCHGRIARIEIAQEEFSRLLSKDLAQEVNRALQKLGFLYVSLDLGGYELGSMNKALSLNPQSTQKQDSPRNTRNTQK